MPHLTVLRLSPTLRMIAAALTALGALFASIYPYQSLIAITEIGLSKPGFGLVLILASAVAVATSVLLGILSDQRANRRLVAVITALAGNAAIALMLIAPSVPSLIISHGILFPAASSLYGQLFALTRLASPADAAQSTAIQATLRAAMSFGFLCMLIYWTWAFAQGDAVLWIYRSAALASAALTLLILRYWPQDGATGWADTPSGLSLTGAFRDIARPAVALRLLCIGAINSAGISTMVLVALVFHGTQNRDASDVALYAGLIAGWEVPVLLLLQPLIRHLPRTQVLATGTALYCLQLALLPVLADSPAVWGLTLLAGIGGSAIISIPIGYYQDMMAGKPGTAGALLALQKLVGDVLAALAFVAGTAIAGYQLTALLACLIAGLGASGLLLADRALKPAQIA